MHYNPVRAAGLTIPVKPFILLPVLLVSFHTSFALTKIWTGRGGDGLWSTAANWNNNSVPAASDDVLLNNSLALTGYSVTLPNTAVIIKTLTIFPGLNDSIQVVLPSGNTTAPGLTVSGPGYGIVINNRGVFRNASGLSTGASLSIADSIQINNGGRYVHSTKSPSASSIVQYLSKAPGTEKGIFEYDVPGVANYDVSVTKRTYGNLVLSATASGSTRTYTGSGTNPLTINGNLQINAGVTFNVDLSGVNGNIVLLGDYVQNGGVFNIAHVANNTLVKIAGNLQQAAAGIITETGVAVPAIELNGTVQQAISLQGTIANSIVFRLNNAAGAVLQSPLALPYKLDLVNGTLTSSTANLLTLSSGCTVSVDSSGANSSYVNGPLRKEGLLNTPWFLFPVGKPPGLQWFGLAQASGNFTAEFIKADPHNLATAPDTSLKTISNTGYWAITTDASPVGSANTALSYAGPNNLGITDMAMLRVAQLSGAKWISRGNTATTGSAGAAGSVTSEWISSFPSSTAYFTLAAGSVQNALADKLTAFSAGRNGGNVLLHWTMPTVENIGYFTVLRADSSMHFSAAGNITAEEYRDDYWFTVPAASPGWNYYRLQVTDKKGHSFFSKIVSLFIDGSDFDIHLAQYLPGNKLHILVRAAENTNLQIMIMNMQGMTVKKFSINAAAGNTTATMRLEELAAGIYQLMARDKRGRTVIRRFIRQ